MLINQNDIVKVDSLESFHHAMISHSGWRLDDVIQRFREEVQCENMDTAVALKWALASQLPEMIVVISM